MPTKLTLNEYVQRVNQKHSNKYDYSNSVYFGMASQILIVCPIHGEFSQLASNHMVGKGCPKCKNNVTSVRCKHSTSDFISKAIKIHGDTYEYTKVKYIKDNTEVIIICKEHGAFAQIARSHLSGCGCPRCAGFNTSKEEFALNANELHLNKYDYDKFSYVKSKEQSIIICPIHGEFYQSPEVHLRGCGCPKCVGMISKDEINLADWLKSLNISVKTTDRELIFPKELDIVLPDYKIAIEYNGLYWHSSAIPNFNKYKHKEKTKACSEINYKLLHIFSDDWIFKKKIVKSIIKSKLRLNMDIVYARKTYCKKISVDRARLFLVKNHIQGYVGSSFHYGLFYENKLLQVMSFKKEQKNFNLVRMATELNTQVVGGASKLFNHFCKNEEFTLVTTFADLSLFDGAVYEKLGFSKVKEIPIDYSYIYKGRRKHKFNFRRKRLKKILPNFNENKSELWNTKENDIYRIYDCGKNKYEYKRNQCS